MNIQRESRIFRPKAHQEAVIKELLKKPTVVVYYATPTNIHNFMLGELDKKREYQSLIVRPLGLA